MSKEPNNLNSDNQSIDVCARKCKLRNWKSPILPASTLNPTVSVPPIDTNSAYPLGHINSNQIESPESTKKYFFPYRQKRLEQWIEPKENQRPYKIRNWQSNSRIGQQSTKYSNISDTTTLKNIHDSTEKDDQSPTIPEIRYGFPTNQKHSIKADVDEIENSDCLSISSSVSSELPVIPELLKRYTFPLRKKHHTEFNTDEIGHSDNFPSTPYWKTAGYSIAVKQEARRRKRSVSSSLLATSKFDHEHEHESDNSKDFSQSVEIPLSSANDSEFNSSSNAFGSTTFAKMKLNFVNCFSKIKRVNSKNNLNKGLDSKKRSFKSLFQSRENINLASKEGGMVSTSNIGKENPNSDFYPSYIPFQKERFEKDVRKRMLELPQN